MAASERTPMGIQHVTVVPENHDPEDRDGEATAATESADRTGGSAN